MTLLAASLPARRSELVIRPLGERDRFVIKDPATGAYFHVGPQEHFLLLHLDGRQEANAVCDAFAKKFDQPLTQAELQEFIELASRRGLLLESRPAPAEIDAGTSSSSGEQPQSAAQRTAARPRQSILYWRTSLVDPDRLITWLEPKLWFCWTPGFLAVSAAAICLAIVLVVTNGRELITYFPGMLRWETFVLAWLTLIVVTTLHEFAHGLTCKHYGGQVHEMGLLLMYFMPCFYCNVSDAWLFREKSKRLWVTFAGGYFELFLWALSVFVWRFTLQDSLVNYLAFVVLSICGIQNLFNFNPLLKLDGYYLISDWLEIPNLRQRAWDYVASRLRWLLWGAPRPARHPAGGVLLGYGVLSWMYSFFFLSLMLWAFFRFLWAGWGWVGLGGVALLTSMSMPGLFRGLSQGEVRTMLRARPRRAAMWAVSIVTLGAGLHLVEMEDRVSGPFLLRAEQRCEVRAQVAGFVREIHFDEGDSLSPGALVARLEIPDLASRIAQKRAAAREAEARLRLLKAGPRKEELVEQRARVERMTVWRDLAVKDLEKARQALEEELGRLDQQIAQCRAECTWAGEAYERAKGLRARRSIADEEFQEFERKHHVAQALLAQAEFQKRHREALGTREALAGLDAEAELARREKDLADAQSALTLLELGTRQEEIAQQEALVDRLNEELDYLESLDEKLHLRSPIGGLVTTSRLKEKVGQYLHEGDLLCVVEDPASLVVEVMLKEQDIARVVPNQRVEIKVRALPFETLPTMVERIAPSTKRDPLPGSFADLPLDNQGLVAVHCRITGSPSALRPGMTGHARIYSGQRSLDWMALDRGLRWLRTEFWW